MVLKKCGTMLKRRQVRLKKNNKLMKLNIQLFADGEIKYMVILDNNGAIKSMKSLSTEADKLDKSFEKVDKKSDKLSEKTKELSSKFTSAGKALTVGLTVPITGFGTYAVKMASDLQEVQNVVDTTFGESSKVINEFAKNAAVQFGISELSAKQFTGTLGAMLKSMGIGNKEVTEMSIALAGLAGDMASFYNLDPTDAFEKLRSGISGETEPLKQLGINMSVVNLESFAMSKGIKKSYDEMTQAEQATLRYQYIMSTTADAQGDYAKTADSTANKTRTTMLQFQTLAAEIGQMLIPAVNDMLTNIQKAIKWFQNLDDGTKRTIITIAKVVAILGPALLIVGKLITVIMTIVNVLKVVKGAIMAVNTVLIANPVILIITAIVALIAILVTAYQKCEWFRDGINAVFGFISSIFQGAIDIFNSIINFFKKNWQTILLFILNPFAGIFKILYDKFDGFRNFVNTIIESIKNFFIGLFDFIKNIVSTVWTYIYNTFLVIVAIVATILETIYNIISPIVGFIYNNILVPIYNFFISVFTSIFNYIVNVFTSIFNFIINFVSMIFNVFGTIAGWIYNNVLMPIFNFFSSTFNSIWGVISNVINWIKSGFLNVANFISTTFDDVRTFISKIFSTIGGIIKAPINGVIGLINGVLKQMNKIKVPDWVPGLGGKGVNFPMIPKLSVGTNYVQHEGLAYLHEGEAVVPKKYNPAVGGYGSYNQPIYVNVVADMDVNKFGKAFVRDIKTFSGGTKNSYNYGGGK